MTRKSEYIPARRNARETESELAQRISRQLLDLVSKIPPTREAAGADADARARALTQIAANKAALAAGTLALPPGPLGWLTLVPELLAIWRIQAQLVADLSGVFGVNARLNREQMLYSVKQTMVEPIRGEIAAATTRENGWFEKLMGAAANAEALAEFSRGRSS